MIEFALICVLQNQIDVFVVVEKAVELKDISVIEEALNVDFSNDQLFRVHPPNHQFAHDFQSDLMAHLLFSGQIDVSELAFAEKPFKVEVFNFELFELHFSVFGDPVIGCSVLAGLAVSSEGRVDFERAEELGKSVKPFLWSLLGAFHHLGDQRIWFSHFELETLLVLNGLSFTRRDSFDCLVGSFVGVEMRVWLVLAQGPFQVRGGLGSTLLFERFVLLKDRFLCEGVFFESPLLGLLSSLQITRRFAQGSVSQAFSIHYFRI